MLKMCCAHIKELLEEFNFFSEQQIIARDALVFIYKIQKGSKVNFLVTWKTVGRSYILSKNENMQNTSTSIDIQRVWVPIENRRVESLKQIQNYYDEFDKIKYNF